MSRIILRKFFNYMLDLENAARDNYIVTRRAFARQAFLSFIFFIFYWTYIFVSL
jgi:hypothetical protein